MSRSNVSLSACLLVICCVQPVSAQQPAASAISRSNVVVPPLVNFSSVLSDFNGKPLTHITGVTFLLYREEQGGAPLWMETQNVQPDKSGHYTVMLGSTTSIGLPPEIFVAGEAHWLGVQPQGQTEQPRILLLSVPYALKAADADTLGGKPASAFVTTNTSADSPAEPGPNATTKGAVGSLAAQNGANGPLAVGGSGTTNFIPKWNSSTALGNSLLYQISGKIGLGTTSPGQALDVKGGIRASLGLSTGTHSVGVDSVNTNAVLINGGGAIGASGANKLLIGSGPAYATTSIYVGGRETITLTKGGSVSMTQIGSATLAPALSATAAEGDQGVRALGGGGSSEAASGGTGLLAEGGTETNMSPTFGGDGIDTYGGNAYQGGIGIYAQGGTSSGVGGGDGIDAYGATGANGQGYSGFFQNGDVNVLGNLGVSGAIVAGTKDFRIDHPLHPADQYLYHASVESSEMKNIYDGVAVLDENGEALVQLPEWFEAVNGDFRYQLTAIGAPGPNLYIASEILDNTFKISGGQAKMKVSWQVTGIRHDAFSRAHPLRVVEDKPANQHGFYLHPELYGQAPERQIEWGRRPQFMKRLQQLHAERLAPATKH